MESSLAGKRILVVEDNPLNMKLVRALLNLHKCRVIEAADAEIALLKAQQHRPDLILMDLHLPTMDGLTATSILKSRPETRHIPIIAVTSCAMEGDREQTLDAGCNGYITKPINTRTFIHSITDLLT